MSSVIAIPPAHPRAVDDLGTRPMPVVARPPSGLRADAIQFRVVYLVTFPIFLLVALVTGLFPSRAGRADEGLSVMIHEAKASAQTCGSFSLMG